MPSVGKKMLFFFKIAIKIEGSAQKIRAGRDNGIPIVLRPNNKVLYDILACYKINFVSYVNRPEPLKTSCTQTKVGNLWKYSGSKILNAIPDNIRHSGFSPPFKKRYLQWIQNQP